MAPKLPRLKAIEVVNILKHHGFTLISQRGSHQKWKHPDSGKQVIVPYHKGKQLPLGTLRSIIEAAEYEKNNFVNKDIKSGWFETEGYENPNPTITIQNEKRLAAVS